MKQMTEAQLRDLLERAYQKGHDECSWYNGHSTDQQELLAYDAGQSRNKHINELMESV